MATEQFYLVIPIPVIADLIAELEVTFDTKDFPVIDAFRLRPLNCSEETFHRQCSDYY